TNAPDFNKDASGVFFGLRTGHDPYDCALAIMRGVACLLRKNIEHFAASGIHADRIISTGGGAKSKFWSQLKANFTGRKVAIPENEEAPCLGAAIIGAVSSGLYPSFEDAISASVKMKEEYSPSRDRKRYNDDYALFEQIYQDLQPSFAMHTQLRSSSRDEGR
ncbi:MAG: hypothetical protein LBB68_11220, partial [Treponema sp.]|nr:hypothetical protein [Treponema sp.]